MYELKKLLCNGGLKAICTSSFLIYEPVHTSIGLFVHLNYILPFKKAGKTVITKQTLNITL